VRDHRRWHAYRLREFSLREICTASDAPQHPAQVEAGHPVSVRRPDGRRKPRQGSVDNPAEHPVPGAL